MRSIVSSILRGSAFSSAISFAIVSGDHCPRASASQSAEQIDRGDLAGEGLRGGDPDLEPGAGEEHRVGVAGRLAAHHVGDRENVGAALAGQPHRRQGVGRLARLGDADDEIVGADDRIAVAVLGGDVHLDRHPRPLLDRVTADQAGVVGGAAGDDDDAASPSPPAPSCSVSSLRSTLSSSGRRSVIVSATASGCSWISFIMKVE